jgi:hypothetical protein
MCKLHHAKKQQTISFTQIENYTPNQIESEWLHCPVIGLGTLRKSFGRVWFNFCPENKDNITMLKVSQIHKRKTTEDG